MMYNILFCSAGRRVKLIQQLKQSLANTGYIITTDMDNTAPALFFSDKYHIVPKITEHNYIKTLLNICIKDNIKVLTTLIDPEIAIIAKERVLFENLGVTLLIPSYETALLCLDKLKMYNYLKNNNIDTINTYNLDQSLNFPVFIKPRYGSGSVGACKINNIDELRHIYEKDYIIQDYMTGIDISVVAYIDCISNEVVSIFAMKKLESKIGGACKVLSYIDNSLFDFVCKLNKLFDFKGPIDIDLFYQDGKYYVTEINPRFGGGYIFAHALGVDFTQLIIKNIHKQINEVNFIDYENDRLLFMYNEVAAISDRHPFVGNAFIRSDI